MIRVTFYKYSNDTYKGFEVSGHAGFAKSGKDIVCSAVSVLTINTVNSIDRLTEDTFVCEQEDGYVRFKFDNGYCQDSQLLIQSYVLGITELAKEYNGKYLQVYFKEV